MNSKAWYLSKTLWVNAIILGLATAESQLQVLSGYLPGGLFAWLSFVLPIVNGVLRLVSTTALATTTANTDKANP